MKKIFISYSSKEYDVASELRSVFIEYGMECWMAPESIPVGSNYAVEIPKAIKDCSVFVLLISENSQSSVWVSKEVDLAVNNKKIIVPIIFNNCQIISPFDFYLTNVQTIQAAGSIDELAKSVFSMIGVDLPKAVNDTAPTQLQSSADHTEKCSREAEAHETFRTSRISTTQSLFWVCPSCGSSNSNSSAQCSKCGKLHSSSPVNNTSKTAFFTADLTKSEQLCSDNWLCPSCGTSNFKNTAQCSKCGKLFSGNRN